MNIVSLTPTSLRKYIQILIVATSLPSTTIAQTGSNEFNYSVAPDASSTRNTPVVPSPGNFSVSPLGGACYTIGIDAPIGQADVQPNISIVYNSQSGNGIVGWGANLSGISVITRGPRTIYADGQAGGISHDYNDAFYLDGQRLVLKEHTNGCDSSVYILENSPFTWVVMHGLNSSSQTDIWFSAIDRNGMSYEYGRLDGKQTYSHEGTTKVNSWYITQCTDSRGNIMTYSYTSNNYYLYPQSIVYGHNLHIATGLTNVVSFSYEARPDTISFSLEGVQGYVLRRLKTITTKSYDTTYRSYTLNYSTSYDTNPTHFSRLVSVNITNGSNGTMDPIQLSWQGLPNLTVQEQGLPVSTTSYNGTVDYSKTFYSSDDINGDGLTDILEKGYVNHNLGSSHNYDFFRIHTAYIDANGNIAFHKGDEMPITSGYTFDSDFYQSYEMPFCMDVNGDCVNEIIIPERKETPDANLIAFHLFCSNSNEYEMQFNLSTSGHKNTCYGAGDLNNDGGGEIAIIEKKHESTYYVGAVMGVVTLSNTFCRPFHFTLADTPVDLHIADMNLDGLADIVVFHSGGYTVYWNDGTWLNSHTTTCTPAYTTYPLSITPRKVFPGDFNGDGITDFLVTVSDNSNWYLELGGGDGTLTQRLACSINAYDQGDISDDDNELSCFVYDMDGDGKSDAVICKAMYLRIIGNYYEFLRTYTYWMRSTGESLQQVKQSSSQKESDALQLYYILGDFNGDGQPELVNNGYDCYNGNNANVSPTWHIYPNSSFNVAAGKVTSVTDGFGTTSISYKSLTDKSIYSRNTETDTPGSSIVDCPPVLHAVSSVVYGDGVCGSQTEEYRYGGLKANLKGKGLLGMSYFKVSNSAKGTATKTGVKKWNSESLMPEKTYERQFLGNDSTSNEIKYSSEKPYVQQAWFTHPDTTATIDMDGNLYWIYTLYDEDTGDLLEKFERWNDGASRIAIYMDYDNYGWQRLPSDIQVERYIPNVSDILTKTHFVYNSRGQKTTRIDNYDSDKPLTRQYTYYDYGNLYTETVSGSGVPTNTKTYTYETSKRFVSSITESAGGQSLYSSYTYDTWGNLSTETRRPTGTNSQTTRYYYDGWNNCIRIQKPAGQYITYKRGWGSSQMQCYYLLEQGTATPWVKTWYDSKGRKTSSETYKALDVHSVRTWQYDNRGNLLKDRVVTGNLVQEDNYTYDSRNRVHTFQNAEGRQLTYTYGNRAVTTVDGAGRSYTKTFNPRGSVLTSSDPGGTVIYTYNADDKPKTIVSNNTTVSLDYDERGNRIKLIDPDAGTMTYTYDAQGRVITQKDARNNTTAFTYDGFGNLSAKTLNGQPYASYTWSYSGTTAGLLTGESSGGVSVSYSYDYNDRLSTKTYTLTGTSLNQTLQYSYTYGSDGLLHGISYPGGLNVSYTYDSYGNKVSTASDGITVWELSAYNGTVTTVSHTSQISSTTTLQTNGVLSALSLKNGQATLGGLTFDYDPATGNLMSRGSSLGTTDYYTYDNMDRLTGADGNTFAYASNGNLTYKTGIGHYTYSSTKPHAVRSIENTTRLMAMSQLDTDFNELGKVSHITDHADGLNMEFYYGLDDERYCSKLKNANGALQKEIVYLDNLDVTINSSGSKLWYYYVDDHVITMRINTGSFNHYFTFTDQVGSILKAVDTSGTQRFSATYDVWGRQTVSSNAIKLIRGYTGHEMLTDFGLINMNGRVYDPLLGRFLSPDNFVQEPNSTQSFNRYSYCLNNPLKYNDPSGDSFLAIGLAIAGAYICGVSTNKGELNPFHWDWKSPGTYMGVAFGALMGYATGFGILNPGSFQFVGNISTPWACVGLSAGTGTYALGKGTDWKFNFHWTTVAGGSGTTEYSQKKLDKKASDAYNEVIRGYRENCYSVYDDVMSQNPSINRMYQFTRELNSFVGNSSKMLGDLSSSPHFYNFLRKQSNGIGATYELEELFRDYQKDGNRFGYYFGNDLRRDVSNYFGTYVGGIIGSAAGPVCSFVGSIIGSSAMRLYTEKSIMENSILELQPKIENNYGYYDFFNLY